MIHVVCVSVCLDRLRKESFLRLRQESPFRAVICAKAQSKHAESAPRRSRYIVPLYCSAAAAASDFIVACRSRNLEQVRVDAQTLRHALPPARNHSE